MTDPLYDKLRDKATETIKFMYLEPSETPDPTHPPVKKYAEAIVDAIWPEIEKLLLLQKESIKALAKQRCDFDCEHCRSRPNG